MADNTGLNRKGTPPIANSLGLGTGLTPFSNQISDLNTQLNQLGKDSLVLNPDYLKKATNEINNQVKAYGQIGSQFQALDLNRARFDKMPQQMAQINREQATLLKGLEKQVKSESDLSQIQAQRFKLQAQNANLNNGGQFSAHSQRQFSQLASLALREASAPLQNMSRTGSNAFGQLNSQFNYSQTLTDSQRNLLRSRQDLGQNLSGYEGFKNNLQAGLNRSPLAAPLAIAGDVGGAAAGIAGTVLPLAQALKQLRGGGGLLGGGETLGSLAGMAGKGAVLAGSAAAGGFVGLQAGNFLAKLANPNAKEQGFGDVMETLGKTLTLGISKLAGALPVVGGTKTEQDTFKAMADALGISDEAKKQKRKDYSSSSEYQIAQQRQLNQISDFVTQSNRQEASLRRDYGRQTFDIRKAQGRTLEDYNIQQGRFALQGQYLGQDYAKTTGRATEDRTKTLQREDFDYQKSRQRNEQDFGRAIEANELQVFRIKRDTTLQSGRLDEDYSRNRVRLEQDSTRDLSRLREDSSRELGRLQEDSTRDLTRLTEDSNRSRLRSNQDYARSSTELARQSSRSMADLNTGFKDSVVSLFAPGLASSKAFQFMKLTRDYSKQKGRIGEDTAFAREGLDLSKGRADEDISRNESRGQADIGRNLSRGTEDINRNLSRGEADIAQSRARGEEDLALQHSRQSFDLLRQETDALKDAQIGLRDNTIQFTRNQGDLDTNHARTLTDINTEYSRTMFDAGQSFARQTEQLNFDIGQSVLNTNRNLADLGTQLQRAGQDFRTSMEQINIERSNAYRDEALSLQEQSQHLKDMGFTADETSKLLASLNNQLKNIKLGSTNPDENGKIPGHALGLPEVPRNNYLARLHKGEMVLTAAGADQYRNYLGGDVNGIPGLGSGQSTMDIGGDPTNFMNKAGDNGLSFGLGAFGPNGTDWGASRSLAASRARGRGPMFSAGFAPPAGGGNSFTIPITVNSQGEKDKLERGKPKIIRAVQDILGGLY